MKTGTKFNTRFEKATPKTKEEIKASCEKSERTKRILTFAATETIFG
jgi:hypothetical protein